jgi:glycerol-3-phosphate dehydrogenase
LKKIETVDWDIIVIGGGATGLGTAVDAASRGYKTLLLEQVDFAKGTSSRSTKLVHGGVRYLAQGNIKLVYEALKERGRLLNNAPHLVKKQAFIIPCYSWFSVLKYFIGLKLYDWLSGAYSFGKSAYLSKTKVTGAINIESTGLKGGIKYYDGQFDDARLAINLAQTAVENNAVILNYVKVTALIKKSSGKIRGVKAYDASINQHYTFNTKVVVNATGVFVDDILQMDKPGTKKLVQPSQGVHIVLGKAFITGSAALMIPQTTDGRVLFAIPWHEHLLVGTTDTTTNVHSLEPKALDTEIDFILATAGQYLCQKPSRKDILSVFAGLRPLAAQEKNNANTKEISRDHKLIISDSGLITITGGKWTTYRKMGEDVVNNAIKTGSLAPIPCITETLKIHGYTNILMEGHLSIYGADRDDIYLLMSRTPALAEQIDEAFPYTKAEVVWAVKNEMAKTIEDVLARRIRILFLDARAAIRMAPAVAAIMAKELDHDDIWQEEQIKDFIILANHYLADNPYI